MKVLQQPGILVAFHSRQRFRNIIPPKCFILVGLLIIMIITFIDENAFFPSYRLIYSTDEHTKFPWKDDTLLNLTNFQFLMNIPNISNKARKGGSHLLPILIHTSRKNFEERSAIRESWGSLKTYKKWTIQLAFLLGIGSNNNPDNNNLTDYDNIERKINEEHDTYGDIVMGTFIDTYENLTYKHLMGYKWVLNFCTEATYILKFDDDVFINIFKWLDWLSDDDDDDDDDGMMVSSYSPLQIYCNLWPASEPFRDKSNKNYISYDEYPEKYFPPFCCGWAYSITFNLVEKIYKVSKDIKFNWLDDVFVTGQLVKKVKELHKEEEINVKNMASEFIMDAAPYRKLCYHDDDDDDDKRNLWKYQREIGVVAKIARGKNFRHDIMCLWNKTVEKRSRIFQNQ